MGRRRLQPIIDAYPDIIKGNMSKEEAEEKIAQLKGFGKKISMIDEEIVQEISVDLVG